MKTLGLLIHVGKFWRHTHPVELTFGFLPAAFGFPNRGDVSLATFTRRSNSGFDTFIIFRMALLNFRNSGDASNCSAVMGGRSSVSPAPAALLARRSTMLFCSLLPGEFLVGQPTSDNMAHYIDEALMSFMFRLL
jgi:hypothetical protein